MPDTEDATEAEAEVEDYHEATDQDELLEARNAARERGDKALAREIDQYLLVKFGYSGDPVPDPDEVETAESSEPMETADAPKARRGRPPKGD